MRQRVVIAIAMANNPDVIIADEPTTALDVTVQAQVLEALETARQETGAAMVLITHDLGVIAGHGRPGAASCTPASWSRPAPSTTSSTPRGCRTRSACSAACRGSTARASGSPRSPARRRRWSNMPPGCPFTPRCPLARPICDEEEPTLTATTSPDHTAACHFSDELVGAEAGQLFRTTVADTAALAEFVRETDDLEQLRTSRNDRRPRRSPARADRAQPRQALPGALAAACCAARSARCTPSAASPSTSPNARRSAWSASRAAARRTTARLLLNLQPATSGEVRYEGRELTSLSRAEMRPLRRDLQIVFQDPFASLDPRMTVNEIVAEPLRIHGLYGDEGRTVVRDLLRTVGLNPEHGNRFPHEFSGGQRQRIGIARALALRPKVLVLDEPVSALDVSIQAGVINLLDELQSELGLSYLFVSHDLSVVRHIADRVAVMYLGTIVETGTSSSSSRAPPTRTPRR